MTHLKRTRAKELKIQASLLLKDLRSEDRKKVHAAATRLLLLPFLKGKNIQDIVSDVPFYQLKHALSVLAIEHGCKDWKELLIKLVREDYFLHFSSSAFLNVWFNNYEEAKEYQQGEGGYLLQCRKDYIVCNEDYIISAGLGNMDAAWQATGYDWVRPASQTAWLRLYKTAKARYDKWQPQLPTHSDKNNRPVWLQKITD